MSYRKTVHINIFCALFFFSNVAISLDFSSKEERLEYLRQRHQTVPSDELAATQDKYQRDLEEKGYIEKTEEVPRAEYVRQKMQERASMVFAAKKQASLENIGYKNISGMARSELPNLPFQPVMVPSEYLIEGTSSFLILGGHRIKQLHEGTVFGTLLVDEFRNSALSLDNPNITVASEPATLSYTKYKEDQWATIIYAEKDGHMFIVEASSKLEGKDRDSFVGLVEGLMTDSLLLSE